MSLSLSVLVRIQKRIMDDPPAAGTRSRTKRSKSHEVRGCCLSGRICVVTLCVLALDFYIIIRLAF